MQNWSGGLVYEYSQEVSNYGLVTLNSDGSAQLLQEYDNLQGQYNRLNLSIITTPPDLLEAVPFPTCSSSAVVDAAAGTAFNSNFTLPSVPPDGQDLIDNGIQNPNNGKLVPVTSLTVSQKVEASGGRVLQGLAIKPLANGDSNLPSGENTSASTATAAAASPKPTKKGVATAVGPSVALLTFVVGCGIFFLF